MKWVCIPPAIHIEFIVIIFIKQMLVMVLGQHLLVDVMVGFLLPEGQFIFFLGA